MKATIFREDSQSTQTLGTFQLFGLNKSELFKCKTLELPDLKNKSKVSCIPKGIYKVTPRTSPKYGLHFLINNVPNRDAILIHFGNFHTDILGCILVGFDFVDINGDGIKDITSSKDTLRKLLKLAPMGFELTIK